MEVAVLGDQEGVEEEEEGTDPRMEGGVELGEVVEQTQLLLALQTFGHY